MNVFARKRDLVLACVAVVLTAMALASAGSARTNAQECFFTKKCRYDIEVRYNHRFFLGGSLLQSTRVTATFPRVVVTHTQNPPPPAKTKQSIGMNGGDHLRPLGTVVADVDITALDCRHSRTYQARAVVELLATIPLSRPVKSLLRVEFAPKNVVAPEWEETCALFRQQSRSLDQIIGRLALFTQPRWTSSFSLAANDFLGAISLRGNYRLETLEPQKENSLVRPLRLLWQGRSVVINERTVKQQGGAKDVYDVRVTFRRR